ncbi:MAG: hypothetical protein KME64_04210 [Scytonematopsis contorta HA4267-MV1]|jgi:hypothetical protein|nr:hypothetical protein [Scytonematopsis contorta HA4267-MV1]
MLNIVKLLLLTTMAVVATSTAALADSLVGNGGGGDYKYQLWRSTDGSSYYLKIWTRESNPNTESSLSTTHSFQSSRDALEYFDCNYAGRSLPSCPK